MRIGLPSPQRPVEHRLLDNRARELAEQAGINWEELNNYPGYGKNVWRELADGLGSRATGLKTQWS
jgi:hypothetical protein